MFSPEQIIDNVQNAKKQAISTFVTHEEIKKGLIEIVDAQTAFSKTVVQNTLLFGQLFVKNFVVSSAK